jgi:hypothetical protein
MLSHPHFTHKHTKETKMYTDLSHIPYYGEDLPQEEKNQGDTK